MVEFGIARRFFTGLCHSLSLPFLDLITCSAVKNWKRKLITSFLTSSSYGNFETDACKFSVNKSMEPIRYFLCRRKSSCFAIGPKSKVAKQTFKIICHSLTSTTIPNKTFDDECASLIWSCEEIMIFSYDSSSISRNVGRSVCFIEVLCSW